MGGIGPITNTRTLKGALIEAIGQLERARQKPLIVRLLQRCREYRQLVDEWDTVSPPADEQFETIGQIMQLLGAAMQAAKQAAKEDPEIEFHPIEPLGLNLDEDEDSLDVVAHRQPEERDRTAGDPHHGLHEGPLRELHESPLQGADVLQLYREPWRPCGKGIRIRMIKRDHEGGCHAVVRLTGGTELAGQKHTRDEHVYVLDGCIRHADTTVHAGACLRFGAGSMSSGIRALGEATLLFIDSDRRTLHL